MNDTQNTNNYEFIFIKDRENTHLYHPIQIEQDICNESYIFKKSALAVYVADLDTYVHMSIDDVVLDPQTKYLIQTKEMGNFGYYSVGNPLYIFENQIEVENDIYHYYFMQFSR